MKLLDVDEVAFVFGIGRWRVYDLARAGVLPYVRLGRQVRFSEEALRLFVERGGRGLAQSIASRDEVET